MGKVIAFPGARSPTVSAANPDWLHRLKAGGKALVLAQDGDGYVVRLYPAITDAEQRVWARYDDYDEALGSALEARRIYPTLYQLVVDQTRAIGGAA